MADPTKRLRRLQAQVKAAELQKGSVLARRNAEVRKLSEEGVTQTAIADAIGGTDRWVREILKGSANGDGAKRGDGS